jgi:hypothetical protein
MQLKNRLRGCRRNCIRITTTEPDFWKMSSSSRKRGGTDALNTPLGLCWPIQYYELDLQKYSAKPITLAHDEILTNARVNRTSKSCNARASYWQNPAAPFYFFLPLVASSVEWTLHAARLPPRPGCIDLRPVQWHLSILHTCLYKINLKHVSFLRAAGWPRRSNSAKPYRVYEAEFKNIFLNPQGIPSATYLAARGSEI